MVGAILSLDLATTLGWGYWKPGLVAPRHGSKTFPKTGDNVGKYADLYERWLDATLDQLEADSVVVFEAPWIGDNTHQATARKLEGLAVITEKRCFQRRIKVFEANNGAVKNHFVGRMYIRGTIVIPKKCAPKERERLEAAKRVERVQLNIQLKRMIVEECIARGWMPHDDNEADALSITDYAACLLGIQVPWDCRSYKDRNRTAVEPESQGRAA